MTGQTLTHYRITAKLGQGGTGEVYRATDTKLGREVALKALPPSFSRDAQSLARFEREARALATLNHPQIAAIHGFDADQGTHFLVLELVEGETLAERLRRGPLPLEEALGWRDKSPRPSRLPTRRGSFIAISNLATSRLHRMAG